MDSNSGLRIVGLGTAALRTPQGVAYELRGLEVWGKSVCGGPDGGWHTELKDRQGVDWTKVEYPATAGLSMSCTCSMYGQSIL